MHTAIRLFRWLIGAPLWAAGGWIIGCNWRLLVRFVSGLFHGRMRPEEPARPLIGPLIFCLGALVVPLRGTMHYSWIALPIDPATYMLIISLLFLARDLVWPKKKTNG